MADVEVRAGDTLPQFDVTITENGRPKDVSDASSIVLRVYNDDGTIRFQGACDSDPDTPGRVIRAWGDGETAEAGTYRADIRVTWAEGQRTYPTDDYISIEFSVPGAARRTGIDPQVVADEYGLGDLTTAQRTRLSARLAEVLGQMESDLNRPVTPRVMEESVTRNPDGSFNTSERIRRLIGALELEARPGVFLVRYLGGLDVEQDMDLRAYLTANAVLRWYNTAPPKERLVLSLTVESQSKTYANTTGVAAGQPGGPPDFSTIAHYQRLRMAHAPTLYDPFVEAARNGGSGRYHWVAGGIGPGEADGDRFPEWGGNEYGQQDEWPGYAG